MFSWSLAEQVAPTHIQLPQDAQGQYIIIIIIIIIIMYERIFSL
jgi:hypothetical protein